MSLYRGMDAEKLETEYSPSSMTGGEYLSFIRRYKMESTRARQLVTVDLDSEYGDQSGQVLDFYHAGGSDSPLHVFIHGGYWQELSSKDAATMARPLVNNGVSLGVVNYTLAPEASIDQMVDECYLALRHLLINASDFGIDPGNISLSGHSAGAQLVMHMLSRYQADDLLQGVRLVVLISGIYDLVPICFTSINKMLGLDTEKARELSPLFNISGISIPILITVAQNDTREFRRQARDYFEQLCSARIPCRLVEIPNRNHFDIVLNWDADPQEILNTILGSNQADFNQFRV